MKGFTPAPRRLRFFLLVTLAVLYLLFFAASVLARGWFDYIGVDFRVYWASARIVQVHGFADVYDFDRQKEFQQAVYEQYAFKAVESPADVIEIPYLPVFIAMLVPFGLMEPLVGFFVWSVLEGVIYFFYLMRLMRVSRASFDAFFIMVCVLSLPLVFNLFFGQIDLVLFIALGETLVAMGRGKDFMAGVWLAGLLLKPQLLVLVLPGLVIQRKWNVLAGFGFAAIVLGGISIVLAGSDGMMAWTRLVLNFASPQGVSTNFTESMMSWRALALNWNSIVPFRFGWVIALMGIVGTALAGLGLWVYAREPEKYLWVWLGTLAATFTVAWHSHVHTAVLLLVPIILGWPEFQFLRELRWWLILPGAVFLFVIWGYTPLALSMDDAANPVGPAFGHIVAGAVLLMVNLIVLYQVWKNLRVAKGKTAYAL